MARRGLPVPVEDSNAAPAATTMETTRYEAAAVAMAGDHEPGERKYPKTIERDMNVPVIPKTRSLSRVVVSC